jgi:hypothetical protein
MSKPYKYILFIFVFISIPVLTMAGNISNPPGRSDDNLQSFLKNKVNTMGDSSTVYYGDGSNLSGVGLSDSLKNILLMKNGYISPPGFFNATNHVNNGYSGQHVRVGDTFYVHERDSANGQSSRKFGKFSFSDGWTQLSSSVSSFCEQGAYAVGPDNKQILFTRGACGGLASATTEIYHIPSNTWFDTSAHFPMSVIAGSTSDFGMNGQMPTYGDTSYYFGGFEASGHGNYAYAYDWSKNTMERIANLPDTWDQASASPVYSSSDTNYIFLQPGEINQLGSPSQEFWRYNINTNSYTQLKEVPSASKSIGGGFVHTLPIGSQYVVFVSSRPSGSGSDSLSVYDTDTNSWSVVYSDVTGGFSGVGLKQVSISTIATEKYDSNNNMFVSLLINPTTNSDMIGYKVVSFFLNSH